MTEPLGEPVPGMDEALRQLGSAADQAAGVGPFAPGEGIEAGIAALGAGLGKDRAITAIMRSVVSKASGIKAFGNSLKEHFPLTSYLVGGAVDAVLHHKKEIVLGIWHHKEEMVTGALTGGATKLALRTALAGSGGLVAAAAVGAVGGALAGGAKEYVRQRKAGIEINEAGNALIIAGLRNEFRRIKAADKTRIRNAAFKGAIWGIIGGVIGAEIAENEWVQHQLSAVWGGAQEKLSAIGEWVQEHGTSNLPTEPPELQFQIGFAPGPSPTPTGVVLPPVPPEIPPTEPTLAAGAVAATGGAPAGLMPPELPPHLTETISLPEGSNPWTATQSYLEQTLGRPPTNSEILEATDRFLSENNIGDAYGVQPGDFKVHGVNEYIQELKGGQPFPAAPEQVTDIRAAEVDKYLPVRDEMASETLKSQRLSAADVDHVSFAKGQESIQRIMEAKANEIHESTIKNVIAHNPSASGDEVKSAYDQAYADWLKSDAGQNEMLKAGSKAVADHLQIEHDLAEKITAGLESDKSLFTDVPITKGMTAGEILNLTWTPADAPVMGANIAANYDMLTEMWAQTAKVHPDLLPNVHFPVSLSEINDLVKRAEAGDELALRRLRQALHWIPAGSKFRVVTALANNNVLKMAA